MRRSALILSVLFVVTAVVSTGLLVGKRGAQFQQQDDSYGMVAGFQAYRTVSVAEPPAAAPVAQARVRAVTSDSVRSAALDRRMVIRSGSMRLRVDSVDGALASIGRAAEIVGATVSYSEARNGDHQPRSATVQLRVVPESFDRLVEALRRLGDVEVLQIGSQDVGEEYVDVEARIANGRRLERRLIELLQTRTGRLSDVLQVETQLQRIRQETDALEGRRRYLDQQVARTTLSVDIHEPGAVMASTGRGLMRESLEQAWANFLMLIALVIQSLGIVIPLGLVALLAWRFRPRPRESGTARSVIPAA